MDWWIDDLTINYSKLEDLTKTNLSHEDFLLNLKYLAISIIDPLIYKSEMRLARNLWLSLDKKLTENTQDLVKSFDAALKSFTISWFYTILENKMFMCIA